MAIIAPLPCPTLTCFFIYRPGRWKRDVRDRTLCPRDGMGLFLDQSPSRAGCAGQTHRFGQSVCGDTGGVAFRRGEGWQTPRGLAKSLQVKIYFFFPSIRRMGCRGFRRVREGVAFTEGEGWQTPQELTKRLEVKVHIFVFCSPGNGFIFYPRADGLPRFT